MRASLPEAIDAATVVVIRDAGADIEVLMLKKSAGIHFGGMWVFPGGRVDPADRQPGDEPGDDLAAFRRAAVREAREEARLALDHTRLVHFSHWLPPPVRPKRFSTHFFLARAPDGAQAIEVDGLEITEHVWMAPRAALARRHAGEIEFVTPTFVTLDWLRRFTSVADAIADIRQVQHFHTRLAKTAAGQIALYHGDVAYETLDPDLPGPRRRANMLSSGWWWEEHDGAGVGPWTEPVDL